MKKDLTQEERDAIENRATLRFKGIKEHTDCEECMEEYFFQMRDNYHDFSIGLTTILSCLAFAEQQGAVPELPEEWWIDINNRY